MYSGWTPISCVVTCEQGFYNIESLLVSDGICDWPFPANLEENCAGLHCAEYPKTSSTTNVNPISILER